MEHDIEVGGADSIAVGRCSPDPPPGGEYSGFK